MQPQVILSLALLGGYLAFMGTVIVCSVKGQPWADKVIGSFGQYPEYGF